MRGLWVAAFGFIASFLWIIKGKGHESQDPGAGHEPPEPPPAPAPVPSPEPVPMPTLPDFKVILWEYRQVCSYSGFLGPCDPARYIMPDNEVVKFVSSYLELTETGRLEWINPNPFGLAGVFQNKYVTDMEQFGVDDYWMNPDYYFMKGMMGDCEDAANAIASVLESKGIRTKVVGGWLTINGSRVRDWIVEFKFQGEYFRYFGGAGFFIGFISRVNFERVKSSRGLDFEPVLMYNKSSYYENYNLGW